MTTQSGDWIQDQNLNSHFRGDSITQSTSVKKIVSVGSRRALADLSNSAKPSTCLASKNHSNKLVATDGEHNVCKPTSPSGGKIKVLIEVPNTGKPSTLRASKKNHKKKLSTENREIDVDINIHKSTISQSSKNHQVITQGKENGRKALTNISNVETLNLHQASKTNQSKKVSFVADESFLHNHKDCIKSKTRAAEMEFFVRTLGLDEDSSMPWPLESVVLEKIQGKVESPLRNWETVEIAELPNEVQTPFQCRTSELLDIDLSSQQCRKFESPKFALMDTPAFSSGLNNQHLAAGL